MQLLTTLPGIYTLPGNPDFNRDGIPDSTDQDDDNDRVPDASDIDPHNSNVPSPLTRASGGESGGDTGSSGDPGNSGDPQDPGAEVTPEVIQGIRDIVSKHPNEYCVECAAEIETYLKEQGIHGERIKLDTVKQREADNFIYDDSQPLKAAPDYVISTNGHHEGIAVKIDGEEKVFDNHHPDGVPREQWMNNLTYFGKEHRGDSFVKLGYLF